MGHNGRSGGTLSLTLGLMARSADPPQKRLWAALRLDHDVCRVSSDAVGERGKIADRWQLDGTNPECEGNRYHPAPRFWPSPRRRWESASPWVLRLTGEGVARSAVRFLRGSFFFVRGAECNDVGR